MERKSNKKVKKYLVICLSFAAVFSFFMLLLARYEITEERRRMITLMTEHPELEAEIIAAWEKHGFRIPFGEAAPEGALNRKEISRAVGMIEDKYGYDLKYTRSAGGLWIFWGAGVLTGILLIALAGYLEWKKSVTAKDHLQELYECLWQFREGRFGEIPDYEEEPSEYSEEWMKVWESLRELGVYFEGLKDKLEEEEKNTKSLITDISHQLKTPLASMKVLSDSLLCQQDVPIELYQEFMNDLSQEIERESKIIDDLLALVKLDKTASGMNIRAENINALVERILKRLRPIAAANNIEMIFESFRPVNAEVDEVKLTLAISNLVENAIKYNKENGWVHVSLNADHKVFYVEVADSGVGIDKENQAHIFERFYRVDKSHSREIGGTGLGLSIARSAVVMHRGAIKVFSQPGEGTTFTVRIPLKYVV